MSHQSADELREKRIAIMGQDLGAIFDSLYNEILWIKFKWIEYVELYGTSEERIDVMNRSAPWLFFIVQRTLFDDILLGLAKIMDPPGVGNKETVSILALSQFINDTDLKKKVSKYIKEIKTNTEFCRDWRNRQIAHKDRKLAIGHKTAIPLIPSNRKSVEDALNSIEKLVRELELHYFKSATAFEVLVSDRGAGTLFPLLGDGLKYRDLEDRDLLL